MDGKFTEPRGWALKWEGAALFPVANCVSQDDRAQKAAAPSTGWALQRRQVTELSMSRSRNGNGGNRLARPQGWALQWDGAALIASVRGEGTASLWAVEREKEGAA